MNRVCFVVFAVVLELYHYLLSGRLGNVSYEMFDVKLVLVNLFLYFFFDLVYAAVVLAL